MKRSRTVAILGLVLALLAYAFGYFTGTARPRALLRSEAPELAWLKKEFNLSDAEFSRISQLHQAYQQPCSERCARIDAKNDELKRLLAQTDSMTPELQRKLAEAAALRLECQTAMLKHFLAVSQAMPREQGKRYLQWIEQQTFMPEHRMAGHHH